MAHKLQHFCHVQVSSSCEDSNVEPRLGLSLLGMAVQGTKLIAGVCDMQKCRLWVCCLLVAAAMFMASAAGAADTVMLQREGWDPTVRQSLNEMFVLYGKGSPNYNPSIRPYAVLILTTLFPFWMWKSSLQSISWSTCALPSSLSKCTPC